MTQPVNLGIKDWENLTIVRSHRQDMAKALYNERRMMSPWMPMPEKHPVMLTWCRHLELANIPFIVVRVSKKTCEIWKERRA